MTDTRIDSITAHDVLARMIATANGGTMPDLDLDVSVDGAPTALVTDPADGRNRLLVTIDAEGCSTVTLSAKVVTCLL